MEKRVVVDQVMIDFKNGGHKNIRFCKQIVDDDGTILSEQFHRAGLAPGGDMGALIALVNDHLENRMKVGKISEEEVQLLTNLDDQIKPILEPKLTEWKAKQSSDRK